MPFISRSYMASLPADKVRSLAQSGIWLGYHPDTHDDLLQAESDRYMGTYLLGVQGSGKSAQLQNMIRAAMERGAAVTVVDPHGDLLQACVSQVPAGRLKDTYLLDLTDEAYPFSLSLLPAVRLTSELAREQGLGRILHVFERLWPKVVEQQYIPLYLPKAIQVFLHNPGFALPDLLKFFLDDTFRASLVSRVPDPTLQAFWQEYDCLAKRDRENRVAPLTNRLHSLFTGNSFVRQLLGQPTTIIFRKAIDAKQIILVNLPIKALPHIAHVVGTILLAEVHAAVFSYADVPPEQRPGVSLYIDEFQHFATSDFAELFTEDRKFGSRLVLTHQQRSQVPQALQDATMTARTTICMQLTVDDAPALARRFDVSEGKVEPEDIEPHVSHYLLTGTSDDQIICTFVETYLRPLQGQKRGTGRVEIDLQAGMPSLWDIWRGERRPNPRIADPTPYLDGLLYQMMTTSCPYLDIPAAIVKGFSNCGRKFFKQARGLVDGDPRLSIAVQYPSYLVVPTPGGGSRWTRPPEDGHEQMLHFIYHLRQVMLKLADNPIGKKTTTSSADELTKAGSLRENRRYYRRYVYPRATGPAAGP